MPRPALLLFACAPALALHPTTDLPARALAVQDTGPESAAQDPDAEESEEKGKKKKERPADKKEELSEAQRAHGYAEIETTLAEMKAEQDRADAAQKVREAQFAVTVAKSALERYRAESRIATEEVELAVERAQDRLTSARTDLRGIEAIYAEETEASAKSEIIRRHEMGVVFAERAVSIAKRKAAVKTEIEIPDKVAQLEFDVEKAEAQIASARLGEKRAQLAADLEVAKKADAAEDLAKKIKRLEKELAKLVEDREAAKADAEEADK